MKSINPCNIPIALDNEGESLDVEARTQIMCYNNKVQILWVEIEEMGETYDVEKMSINMLEAMLVSLNGDHVKLYEKHANSISTLKEKEEIMK